MLLRILLAVVAIVLCISFSWFFVSRVKFEHSRGHISTFYCHWFGPKTRVEQPIIFLPGTKGSLLWQTHRERWLAMGQLLHDTEPFTLSADETSVIPAGILTRLAFIPGLLEYAPYQKISAALACQKHAYFFSYDWRKSVPHNAKLLGKLVERVRTETGQKPTIISHSMGGLIAQTYLKTHSENLGSMVHVGVPFGSGAGFIPDIDQGVTTGLNNTILSAAAIFSHEGSYALLPHASTTLYKGDDLMQVETWKKHSLSVFRDTTRDRAKDEAWLTHILAETTSWQRLLDTPANLSNRFLFVVGTCQPTPEVIEADGTTRMSEGDGRVLASAAYPVEKNQLNKQIITSCAPHDAQLSDDNTIDQIFRFIQADGS